MGVHEDTLQGLQDMLDYVKGDTSKCRSRVQEINITPLREYSKEEIKRLRVDNNYTQSVFALLLGVSPKAVEAWESGRNKPSGSTIRILQIIEQDPHALEEYKIIS